MIANLKPELLTVAEMAQADRLAIAAGTTGVALMRQAGEAVARAAMACVEGTPARRFLVLCGPGNNGGDGYVAAAALRDAGHDVAVASLVTAGHLDGDAAEAARIWGGPVGTLPGADLDRAEAVIDALFGAGLSRPLAGDAAVMVRRLNASGKPVIAVDVPSGVEGDTGAVREVAVEATRTVTFFRLKPGHLLQPGHSLCGSITLADIGIPEAVLAEIRPTHFLDTPDLWRARYPVPGPQGHKYSRGHALVVSGAMPTTGAARLAARGALRIGAGLVTVASPPDAVAAHAARLDAVMLRPFEGLAGLEEVLSDPRRNAVVLGPGLGVGEATRHMVEAALRPAAEDRRRSIVLDADALTSFAGAAARLGALVAGARGAVVATPHDGEFTRLFEGQGGAFTDPNKISRARAGAALLGAVLILKGDDTVVAEPGGRVAIAAADAPYLATAGSGDVLSGFVGGLMAQGLDGFDAACAAVYLHAAAARRFGPGLISEDLPETLPAVLRDLLGG